MVSPFPGMDPYLEYYWGDVHHNLITFIQGALNSQLPERLIARVEERVLLESEEGFIEIIDVGSGHRVVTVIEVLSATNKIPGEGQELYLRKQRELLRTDVNLVEIDLLRGGERVLVIPPRQLRLEHQTPYHICVRRGSKPQDLEVYPIKLQEAPSSFSHPATANGCRCRPRRATADRPVLPQWTVWRHHQLQDAARTPAHGRRRHVG